MALHAVTEYLSLPANLRTESTGISLTRSAASDTGTCNVDGNCPLFAGISASAARGFVIAAGRTKGVLRLAVPLLNNLFYPWHYFGS